MNVKYFADTDTSRVLCLVSAGCTWAGGWELARDLKVEIRVTNEATLAVISLSDEEYGAGPSLEDAVQDLLTSLSDYRESLEEREAKLGPPATADLEQLRNLILRREHLGDGR